MKRASIELAQASNETRQAVLLHVANRLEEVEDELLALNADRGRCLPRVRPGRDRLTLTESADRGHGDSPAPDRRGTRPAV